MATLLRSANSFGDTTPTVVAPDRLAKVPVVDSLPVQFYPPTRLHLLDTTVDGTTCLTWSKGATDRAAQIAVLSGQGLPIPIGADPQIQHVVKDSRTPGAVEAASARGLSLLAGAADVHGEANVGGVLVSGGQMPDDTK